MVTAVLTDLDTVVVAPTATAMVADTGISLVTAVVVLTPFIDLPCREA